MSGKTQWPEVVGLSAEDAKKVIEGETNNVTIQVLNELSPVTMDYREDRVRIFTNADNKVTVAPIIG